MALNIYNVSNHALSGEQARLVSAFSSDEYAGVLGTTDSATSPVFYKNGTTIGVNSGVVINDSISILGGGCLITIPAAEISSISIEGNEGKYYYINVDLQNNFETDLITSDSSSYVTFVTSSYNPSDFVEYNHKTIYNGTSFMIPLFGITSEGEVDSLAIAKTNVNDVTYLTEAALQNLLNSLYSVFTQQAGCTDTYPDGGKIGNFKINQDTILHCYINSGQIIWEEWIKANNNEIVLPQTQYTNGFLTVNNHTVTNIGNTIPVEKGGTGATTRAAAKQGLGIYYGKKDPNVSSPIASPQKGDLYFRILT